MIPTDKWVRKYHHPRYTVEGRNGHHAVDLYTDAGCMLTAATGMTKLDAEQTRTIANDAVYRGKMAILRDTDPQQLIGVLEVCIEQLDGYANEVRGDGGKEVVALAAEHDAGLLSKLITALEEEL